MECVIPEVNTSVIPEDKTSGTYFRTALTNDLIIQEPFSTFLKDNAQRMPYRKIKGLAPNKGQRKLFHAKLQFLTEVRSRLPPGQKIRIVYAGASPGCSIHILDNLLKGPEWIEKWILYDTVAFDSRLLANKLRFECHSRYFTDVDAQALSNWEKLQDGPKIVFITDIRRAPPGKPNGDDYSDEADILIFGDLHLDNNWLCTIKPWMWHRKFRMPYNNVTINGINMSEMQCIPGTTSFQCWIGSGSTELRRWGTIQDIENFMADPKNPKYTVDFKVYEEQLQYFNAVVRTHDYKHNIQLKGLCYCMDCNLEIHIWTRYFEVFEKSQPTVMDVGKMIEWLDEGKRMPPDSHLVDTKSPHGKYPWLPFAERAEKLKSEISAYTASKEKKKSHRKKEPNSPNKKEPNSPNKKEPNSPKKKEPNSPKKGQECVECHEIHYPKFATYKRCQKCQFKK
jgi:hypothetical protein